MGVKVALCEVWEKGGEGGVELGEAILDLLENETANFKPLYDVKLPIKEKIEIIAKEIYRADGVDFSTAAERNAKRLTGFGLGPRWVVRVGKLSWDGRERPSRPLIFLKL